MTIPPEDEITPVAPDVPPVTVSPPTKGLVLSFISLYFNVDVDGTA